MKDKKTNDDMVFDPKEIPLCKHHTALSWMEGEYINNNDGTVSCTECPWGCRLPGYTRCQDGKIIDLRTLN